MGINQEDEWWRLVPTTNFGNILCHQMSLCASTGIKVGHFSVLLTFPRVDNMEAKKKKKKKKKHPPILT